jgi:hypothetical protein
MESTSRYIMEAPKVPFVSLASPFTPSGNTVLVTGGASGIDEFAFNHMLCRVCTETLQALASLLLQSCWI